MASKDKLGFFKVGLMYIGLLLSVVAVFLGSLHYFKGEKIISTVITFVLILCCYFIIDQLVRKKEELRKNSSYNRRLSFLLYSLYFLIALPLSFFTIHGLNVELNAKKEIQNSYKTVATDLDIMTSDFNNYAEQMRSQIKIELQNLMASKKISKENKDTLQIKYGINDELLASTPYNVITNNKTNDIFDKLIANQRKLNDEYSPLILASSQKIIKWNLFQLHQSILEVDSTTSELKNKTENLFNTDARKYSFPSKLLLKEIKRNFDFSKPLVMFEEYKAYLLLLLALLQHLLILAPLFLSFNKGGTYGSKSNTDGITI